MGHPWPLFHLPFQTTLQFLQQINVKKCPFSIQCWYSNPQPSEHESPPITTRLSYFNVSKNFKKNKVFLFQNSENFFFCVPFISFLPLSLSLSLFRTITQWTSFNITQPNNINFALILPNLDGNVITIKD